MKTYVLHERCPNDKEEEVLGVYSTPEKALEKMRVYYGEYTVVEEHDVDGYDTHFRKTIVTKDCHNEDAVLVITPMIFYLDEA